VAVVPTTAPAVAETLVGASVHEASTGAPVQVNAIVPAKLFSEVALTTKLPVLPAVTDSDGGIVDSEKSGTVEAALSATVWGLEASLSAMFSVADSDADVDDVNVTEIEQLAPAATDAPQVFVCWKSAALVPVIVMPVIVRAVAPLLVRVTACGEVPKDSEFGDTTIKDGATVPVPDNGTVWGLLASLLAMLSVADSAAVVEGLKATLIVQVAKCAKVTPQVVAV
jgi:hypothetical protein